MSDVVADQPRARGILVIISSPSGAGKTTLSRRLLAEFEGQLEFSVSYTTRPQRVGEKDGRDYNFVDAERFAEMVEAGEFAEHARVHGNHYGTARSTVEGALSGGRDVVFDVDWQGGQSLSAQWSDDALMIFIVPPDLGTLAERLRRRATDSSAVIERRLRGALIELGHHDEYAHVVVNDDLEQAYVLLRAIYLVRRAGTKGVEDDDSAPGELRALVEANQARGRAHAEALVAASKPGQQYE